MEQVSSSSDEVEPLISDAVLDRPKFQDTRLGTIVLGIIPIVIAFGIWAALPLWTPDWLRIAVPSLPDTVSALHDDIFVSGRIFSAVQVTAYAWLVGLLAAAVPGVILGVSMGLVRSVQTLLYPLTVAFQAIPLIGIAPLVILVFGFGITSKIVIASIVAFFPILVGVMQGMRAVRLDELDLLRTLRASSWQVFTKVRIPRAVPSAFGGFQLAAVFALIGAVVGEFLGAMDGLGFLIATRAARLQVPGVYSAIIVISTLAVALSLALRALDQRLSNWSEA